jgi:hypothetical protein
VMNTGIANAGQPLVNLVSPRERAPCLLSRVMDADLHEALRVRFVERVMESAALPAARRSDVEVAPRFSIAGDEVSCTCGITGSTYTARWDGTDASAFRLADEAAEGTAHLVTSTPHYAWLRSSAESS